VARHFSRTIVSLDATTEELYHIVRGVRALTTVEKGVARLRRLAPEMPISARATLHRLNFRELPNLIDHARAMGLDGISFLPAVACNAPYMSVVVEADGSVRPCFFHERIGNIRSAPLEDIVAQNLPPFRENLDFKTNPVCTRCVCSIRTGWRNATWQ